MAAEGTIKPIGSLCGAVTGVGKALEGLDEILSAFIEALKKLIEASEGHCSGLEWSY